MINYIKITVVTTVLLAVFVVGFAFAQGEKSKSRSEPSGNKDKGVVEVTVTGNNFCLGCALKKEKGAGAQCSIFGHKHSLRVTKAIAADSTELVEMQGWVLHYLETEKSQELIKGHHGENITITGKVYSDERVLEVDKFKKADE